MKTFSKQFLQKNDYLTWPSYDLEKIGDEEFLVGKNKIFFLMFKNHIFSSGKTKSCHRHAAFYVYNMFKICFKINMVT